MGWIQPAPSNARFEIWHFVIVILIVILIAMSRLFDHEKLEVYQALESAAALDVLVAKGRCSGEEVSPGKDRLWSIVSMLVGLIKANSDYRLHDGN